MDKYITILDGGLGTEIQKAKLEFDVCPEELNITNSESVVKIHKNYVLAGADYIYTNTFGANGYKAKNCIYSVSQLISAGVECGKKAVSGTKTRVALSIGPIGKMMKPNGDLTFEKAYEYFKNMVIAGENADIIAFETFSDLLELKAAVLAAKENTNIPIFATMTFERGGRTFTGVCVEAMANVLEGLGVSAIGFNCSLAPSELLEIVKTLSLLTTLPIIVKANAGLPNLKTNKYDIEAAEFLKTSKPLIDIGVSIIGGCCGTTPEYIRLLSAAFKNKKVKSRKIKKMSTLTTATKAVNIDHVCIVGERINPTGKKMFKQALKENNISYILSQALQQIDAGAEILDINVGLPEIDEKETMINVIEEVQSVCDVPLQIDTSDKDVLQAALRIYNGKPLVNSVNGDDDVLNTILPIVKKYGASVIGLTLDKNGIPKKAVQRVAIAKRIIAKALSFGIKKEDIFIDCLCLTASVEQDGAYETLKAVKSVKRLGVKTVLGVSNVSFGLPNRELLNSSFLIMALLQGLDLPIINPNIKAMTDSVDAYNVFSGNDKGSSVFISKNSEGEIVEIKQTGDLTYGVINGIKQIARGETKELLKTREPMDIVNNILIPALDKVGVDFEKKIIFLPQLLSSATAAQEAFEEIKVYLSNKNEISISKGTILLATVEGDIHDIGKNIVKVVLENYGYTVIDLGKDVSVERVVREAKKANVELVGLSALMTTTVVSMEKTIKALRKETKCKIMVGGAVLTESYAKKIGADFYSKDAKQAVDIAKFIFR